MSSPPRPPLDMKFPVRHSFPAEHIQAFGSGKVDRLYLTFASDGTIEKAEAGLIDAPYKRMVIDDPAILRIFGKRGDRIDMNALHPAAKFRLDPLEIVDDENGNVDLASFDIGRLVDITHLPLAARYGWSENHLGKADPTAEGEVHKRVRGALIFSKSKQTSGRLVGIARPMHALPKIAPSSLTLRSAVKTRTDSGSAQVSDVPSFQPDHRIRNNADRQRIRATKSPRYLVPSPPASTAPEDSSLDSRKPTLPVRPSTPTRKVRRNTPVPNGPQGQRMSAVYQQIMDQLSEEAQLAYCNYVTVTRKETAKNTQMKRQFHHELDTFVHQHVIVDLHNEYAIIQKRSGPNKAYHLPTFGTENSIAS
jgi:hypothetical protein